MEVKNKLEIMLVLAFAFATLFYPFEVGLNATLFHLLLVVAGIWLVPGLLQTSKGRFALLLNVFAGLSLFMYGNALSVIAVLAAATYLAGMMQSPHASVFYSTLLAPVNFFSLPVRMLVRFLRSYSRKSNTGTPRILAFVIIPSLLVVLFIWLYARASPVFAQVAQTYMAHFSPGRFVAALIIGLAWLFYVFYFYQYRKFALMQLRFGDNLSERRRGSIRGIDRSMEQKMGMLVLTPLVLLLAIVILSEFLYTGESGHFADELHRSTKALVTSIVLSILTIQWFLRYRSGRLFEWQFPVKILATLWMALNLGLVVITFGKNFEYVQTLGLSYLRIIIFFYLLACVTGIIYTVIRIFSDRNLWYLTRKNAMAILVMLVMASIIPWDMVITRMNLQIAARNNRIPDTGYIMELRHYDRLALYQYDESVIGDASKREYRHMRSEDAYYPEHYPISTTLNEVYNKSTFKTHVHTKD